MNDVKTPPNWLSWSQQLQAIAQIGLTYSQNPFDRERFLEIRRIAAEIMATHSGESLETIQLLFNAQSGYATPKIDVRGVLFREEKILMVRELMDGGRWTLPGGWADVNDSPSAAVEREMREEAGMVVKAEKLLAVYDRNLHGHPPYPFHAYKLFFRCEFVAECSADETETSTPMFFSLGDLPELSLARVTPEEIVRMFDFLADPSLPTDYD